MTEDRPLSGRVAVVTGASRGIGRAAAIKLASAGAHIVAIARTQGGLEELDDEIAAATGEGATLVPLNLNDFDAIDRLAAGIFERFRRTDILVGNAGILGELTPVAHIEPKIWQNLLDINITANYRLIRAFDPLLRTSDAGRAIFVGSGVARQARSFWGGYAMSKAALETLVLTYAQEVRTTPLKVNILNPGPTRTAMRAQAMPGEDPMTLPAPADVADLAHSMCSPEWTGTGEVVSYRDWSGA
jgi:NAD(P)-dependent dehydrogenase (short-subunit alcohol dehydrogenase family)